jgi:glycosyltransferase involved in cell wall biosynthesis
LKLFEYLALAKAIVAPSAPNIREVLVDGENALLFDPADPRGFEDSLTRLCVDAGLRARVARAAGESIERLGLTWGHNARRVVALAVRAGAGPRVSLELDA